MRRPNAAAALSHPQQVADELTTTPVTIRALIRSGELPAIQVDGRGQWRIERTKLEEYIAGAYAKARAETRNGAIELQDGST